MMSGVEVGWRIECFTARAIERGVGGRARPNDAATFERTAWFRQTTSYQAVEQACICSSALRHIESWLFELVLEGTRRVTSVGQVSVSHPARSAVRVFFVVWGLSARRASKEILQFPHEVASVFFGGAHESRCRGYELSSLGSSLVTFCVQA